MTLYYNLLAQRLKTPHSIEGISTFMPQKRVEPRYDDKPKKQQNNMYSLDKEQPQHNSYQEPEITCKPDYAEKEERLNKKISTDEFRVASEAIINCNNSPYPLEALTTGVIAKIPVVLAGLTLQLNLDSIINLPEWVSEIKQTKKQVKITQCKLMQDTNVLFIKGFICRSIEYTPTNVQDENGLAGKNSHWAGESPFNCTTSVSFNGVKPTTVKVNTICELEYLKRKDSRESHFSHNEDHLTCDVSEFNQISTAFYNELPFCELVESKIVEVNEVGKAVGSSCSPFTGKGVLNCISEKMIIYLTLKILQYQQVAIAKI